MRLSDVRINQDRQICRLEATVTSPALRKPFLLYYEVPSALRDAIDIDHGDAFLPALLLPAMAAGETLEIPVSISPKLANNIHNIQTIYSCFDTTLKRVEVKAPIRDKQLSHPTQIGLFFSSGADSTYSLLRNTIDHPLNRGSITHLIVLHGLDIRMDQAHKSGVAERRMVNARNIGEQLGKSVISAATNARELMELFHYRWTFAHGAVLASVGLHLQHLFRMIYIAAGTTYREIHADGSHPLLDPLWGTEDTEFIHDGLEATRVEKMKLAGDSPLALGTLRVCWNEQSTEFNCGRCSKCLRTMVALHIAGALERSGTFPHSFSIEALERLDQTAPSEAAKIQELVDALGKTDRDKAIRAALRVSLDRGKRYFELVERARSHVKELIPVEEIFILLDEDWLRGYLGAGRRVLPFTEREGEYFGPPEDDDAAIAEFHRLKAQGAKYLVYWPPCAWWFEYYKGFQTYLRSNFPRVLEDDSLIVFDIADRAMPSR